MAHRRGYVMLMSVLAVSVLGLAIALGLLSVGSAAAQSEVALERAAKARALADGCAELALLNAAPCTDSTQTWQTADGTCSSTTHVVDADRAIHVQAAAGTSNRFVNIAVHFLEGVPPTIQWQESAQ